MKNLKKFEDFSNVNEGIGSAKELAKKLDDLIVSIDEDMSYVDFAQAVATVLYESYGTHNYEPFIKELKKTLKKL